MRATFMYGAGDVRVIDVPDPTVQYPTDAVVRVVRSCVCGSDLHPYHDLPDTPGGTSMGHEFIGVVEDIGSDVATIRKGDFVIAPFAWSDNTCEFCREGLQTSCRHGGFWNSAGVGGGQADAVRVPLADGTLVAVPGITEDSPLLPSLLTLSDVYGTGWHAARRGGVQPGTTVTVIGDGAVGLLAVLSAKQLGAQQIILMGRHATRTDLGRELGATDVVEARGDEGVALVREITGGYGSQVVIEAVGHMPAYEQAVAIVRPGGVISRVGVPQYEDAPVGFGSLFGGNITLTGGPAPARAYIEHLLPGVLDGSVDPGRVFDRTVGLADILTGYQEMDDRKALKVFWSPGSGSISATINQPERTGQTMELRTTTNTVKTPAHNFTGDVYMNPIFAGDGTSRLVAALVRFTPGARTNWHSHANGQLLHCTDGTGFVSTRDGQVLRLRAGDSVWTPAGEEHWHGGTATNMMCHYAILEETPHGDATTWLEPVTDEQYAATNSAGA